MTAAYRMKGLGWFGSCVAIILGFYLVSLQVASERKKVEALNGRIRDAERDIRALETEFDTRANLAQLEKWNGDILALSSPTASQFVPDEAALAAIDLHAVPNMGEGGAAQMAALLVPALPVAPVVTAPVAVAAVAVAKPTSAASAPAPAAVRVAAVSQAVPEAAPKPRLVRIASAVRSAAVAKVRPQAVAMLDRKLLSDQTFGDILTGARTERARKR
ncbi:hypothetical protein ASE75_00865 [Sphingomonas sp. Leaf17]|uniref:hypothetical protein n=1 Tax=Sphingomonas sp. Leaf17 TaxID=1735683 RepID=UPI0006F56AE1|nr:hypothetical protein [Sphingomonas sp. Leaf17]KQM67533.1 hypothetical protein ASE75_00865 [Sphingomonas sp. Leaf17]